MANSIIPVKVWKLWNGYFPVPDYEVQRCRVLRVTLDVQLIDYHSKEIVDRIEITPDKADDGTRSGFRRRHKDPRQLGDYEVILFHPDKFRAPENAKKAPIT